MIETFLVKRRAHYRGELGLFPNSEMAEEDLAAFSLNMELMAKLWSEKKIEQLRYLWALVHKTADNTSYFLDKDDAMAGLKIRVGFSKAVIDYRTGEIETKPKSLTRISEVQLRLLTGQIQAVICNEILPGISQKHLREEIEAMINERAS